MEKTSVCRAFNESKIQRVLDSILGEESPKAQTGKTTKPGDRTAHESSPTPEWEHLRRFLDFRKEGPIRNEVTGWDFTIDPPMKLREAIRSTCLHCVGGESAKDVRDCSGTSAPGKRCELWPYRIRGKIDRSKGPVLSPLKAVRQYCLSCQGNDPAGVRECSDTYCFLWPYRMGKTPDCMVSETEREARRKGAAARYGKQGDGESENEG